MPEPSTAALLTPDAAARLAEFARACKAAARAVSLYPGGHPAIAMSLGRLAQITSSLTASGPYRLHVLSDRLLVGNAAPPKPDSGVSELAELLHRHLVGTLTLNAGAGEESWRTLLLLLARAPEEVRNDGGIEHLWTTAGGPSIEVQEIDYAEVLREQGGGAAVEAIVAAALGGRLDLDDSGMRLLLDIEQGLDPMFRRMGRAAGTLSADAMLALLDQRHRPNGMAAEIDVAEAVVSQMDDAAVAQFVAGAVIKERGASERLAHAFQALVPDVERQRQLLGLAEAEAARSEIGDDNFAELWSRVEGMLTSYSDETFVSGEYARELAGARTRPIDVERTSNDPPDRIASWLSTVADASLRQLDHLLLVDLLGIERDPARWRDIADTVAGHAEDLVRVGYIDQAWQLAEAIVVQGEQDPTRRPHSVTALGRFARAPMMKHVAAHLRSASDASYEQFRGICHAIGPPVIPPLAEALSAEQDARSRRRLRDILLGFGARGRESVRQLMNAPNWEVRRTAAFLLREFGGAEGLKELVPLLADSEPLVQREAVQGLVMNGSEEASGILLDAITKATGRTRETLLNELRDARAAPLFCYLVRHLDRGRDPQLYAMAVDALGAFGGPDAVEALKAALHGGDWRAPLRTRRQRAAAAQALRRIGTPAALDVLREASASGPRGVRAAARTELSQTD